jgi:fluoride exporter
VLAVRNEYITHYQIIKKMNFLAVFIGGGLGSLTRYGISLGFQRAGVLQFPLATLISNTLACVIMGVALYYFKQKTIQVEWISLVVLTGFCGGFSTFSTFSYETFQLMQQGAYAWAITNVLLSVFLGLGSMWMLLKN